VCRRLYKLVRKADVTSMRGKQRRNHPGEYIQQEYHER